MNNKLGIFLFAAALIFGMSILSFAEEAVTTTTQATVEKAIDAGNKICPVSGENIDEAKKATYEYEGKVYNFCCPACIDEFKKEPQKYIQKVEDELKAPAKVEKDGSKMTESMPMSGHGDHHH